MFTIQYEAINGEQQLVTFDAKSRQRLTCFLAQFPHPVVAVFEQANVITKAARKDLATWPGTLSRAARDFINCRP